MRRPPRSCARCQINQAHHPNVWCSVCDQATTDKELSALLYDDRSGIYGLYEVIDSARDAMRANAELEGGGYGLMLRKVTGQSGARSQLDRRSLDEEMWDRRDAALDRYDFEQETC